MRNILFRGKNKNTGDWYCGDFVNMGYGYDKATPHIAYFRKHSNDSKFKSALGFSCNFYEIDPQTVGQFTGLEDYNGKYIFEGDILKFEWRDGEQLFGMVIWDDESASFDIKAMNYRVCPHFGLMNSTEFEVIGNIHDNPELLKAEVKE